MTPPPRNVSVDEASAYAWADLNETQFLTAFFEHLQAVMGEAFDTYRFFILCSHDPKAVPRSATVAHERKVLIILSEETGVPRPDLADDYLAVFKGYLSAEGQRPNLLAFNIGYVRGVPVAPAGPIGERDVDVFFSGNLNINRRDLYRALHPVLRWLPGALMYSRLGRKILNRLPLAARADFSRRFARAYIRFTSGFKEGLDLASYGRMLGQSKIALCPKGFHSTETFRHLESMRAGTVVISEPLPDTHFYRGSPIQQVPNWTAGLALADRLLADPERLRRLQAETLAWWDTVCSELATARYVAAKLTALDPAVHPEANLDAASR